MSSPRPCGGSASSAWRTSCCVLVLSAPALVWGPHVKRFSLAALRILHPESVIRGGALAHVEACQSDPSLQPCIRRADGPDHDASFASGARLRGMGPSFGSV